MLYFLKGVAQSEIIHIHNLNPDEFCLVLTNELNKAISIEFIIKKSYTTTTIITTPTKKENQTILLLSISKIFLM